MGVLLTFLGFFALLGLLKLFGGRGASAGSFASAEEPDICRYCGVTINGVRGTCSNSPSGRHVGLRQDGKHCIYCGVTINGVWGYCNHSPNHRHQLAQ